MKKQTILYILIAIALVSVGAFLLFKRRKPDFATIPDTNGDPSALPSPLGCTTMLKRGSRGDQVKVLQVHLNTVLPSPFQLLKVDGDFGPATESALKAVYNITKTTLQSLKLC